MALSATDRELVAQRAHYRCEYCLLHQDHSAKSHHTDHIIPRKHGGSDEHNNLAWACFLCNSAKSSEVAAYDQETGQLIAIFNPRTDTWSEHFYTKDGVIEGITAKGRVTAMVLQLNRTDRVETRRILSRIDLYP